MFENDELKIIIKDFDPKKIIQIYGVAILIRMILEKENIHFNKNGEHYYSILHSRIHYSNKSVKSDHNSFIISAINLLDQITKKEYELEDLKIKLINALDKDEKNYFNFQQIKDSSKIFENIFILSKEIISMEPFFYLYYGEDEKNYKKIFFSDEKLENNFYKLQIFKNSNPSIFSIDFAKEVKNITKQKKEIILEKYNIDKEKEFELFDLLGGWKDRKNCLSNTNSKERDILFDIIFFFSNYLNPSIEREDLKNKLYPFLKHPFIYNIPGKIKKVFISEIIKRYEVNDIYEKEFNWKIEIDKAEKVFIIKEEGEEEIKSKNLFRKEDNKIIFRPYEKKQKIFKKLFKALEDDGVKIPKENKLNIINFNRTIILVGPAGHGKTSYLKEVMNCYNKNNKTIKVISPSWKSLNNFNENFKDKKTVQSFEKNEKNKEFKNNFFKEVDLLIIDELSLISYWDFLENIESINKKIRIIIAGDTNQLKPIANNDLNFILLIEVAKKEGKIIDLKKGENFRQKNIFNKEIIEIQKNILKRELNFKRDIYGIEYFSSIKKIFEEIFSYSKKGYIFITQKERGILGSIFINKYLQFKNKGNNNFQVKDKIYFFKNSNQIFNEEDEYHNGDLGIIKDIRDGFFVIEINKNKIIEIGKTNNPPFTHFYALNAHKAQGSSIKKVIVIMYFEENIDYTWLYTAYSRASYDARIFFIIKNNIK